jgi:hypothetical protein
VIGQFLRVALHKLLVFQQKADSRMGKKKNLTKDSCDNGPVLTQPVTSPPLKAVNCNGNSDCKGSNTQTNGLIYEPDESQSVNHVNGTDCDDDAPSDATNQLNSHTNQFLSSHDSEGDTRVVNGTVDEISANVSSLKIDSESSQNSCSSRTVVSPSLADQVSYVVYESELQMPDIMRLIQKDLSEPYSIYTYRYFIHNWPHLCFMVCFHRNFFGRGQQRFLKLAPNLDHLFSASHGAWSPVRLRA